MSLDLDKIKLQQFHDKLQVTIFDLDGKVMASCDSVLQVDRGTPIYVQFLFLQSLQEVFATMALGEEQRFTEVEWEEGTKGLFHLIFQRQNSPDGHGLIQWTIIDNTFYYDKLRTLQQSRNESVISEEFAQIKKRMIEAEKDLLTYKNEELQRVQQFKADFFAKVSHEMRTPLNSISGLVDLLSAQPSNEYLSALKSTSKHLNAIINDVLDLSKIESSKLTFEEIDFELGAMLKAITDGFLFACQQKGIELRCDLPVEGLYLKGDPTRLSQIVYNLIGNSIKFTEEGTVELAVAVDSKDAQAVDLSFSISDSGIGMEADTIDKILEPYAQASSETSRLYGGTGLGLSIAKQLITAFGGTLKIESELGKGTSMSFSIQLKLGDAEMITTNGPESSSKGLSGLHLLVAEDDPVSAKVLQEQLKANGASVDLVNDGQNLWEALENSNIDLVVADVNLPLRTGPEVFEVARKNGNAVPFIFLSGDDMRSSSDLKAHQGWKFIMKPAETSELIRGIRELTTKEVPVIEVDLSKIKSMIADDKVVRDLLQTILDSLPKELELLKEAVHNQNSEQLDKGLHKIKPSIDYLGIPSLADERRTLKEGLQNPVTTAYKEELQSFIDTAKLALENLQKVM